MSYLDNIFFAILLAIGIGYFTINVKKLIRNIKLGKDVNRSDNASERWKNMAMIALGQSKMVKKPIMGFLHIIVYVGFIVINLEVLEIIIDGIFGTHRVFSFLGSFYSFLIGTFEILAILVFFIGKSELICSSTFILVVSLLIVILVTLPTTKPLIVTGAETVNPSTFSYSTYRFL
jgi:hypothetical protein